MKTTVEDAVWSLNVKLLRQLVEYLVDVHQLDPKFANLRLVHDAQQDDLNVEDRRAFCYVVSDQPYTIYGTQALNKLPVSFAMGVLYHEIGHLATQEFKATGEPVVDAWCVEFAPELRYQYANVIYPGAHGKALAVNLQRIDARPIRAYWDKRKAPR